MKSPDAEGKSTNIVFKVNELPKMGHAAFPRYCNADTNGVVWVTVVWTMYRLSQALEMIHAIGPSRNMGYSGDSVKTQQVGTNPNIQVHFYFCAIRCIPKIVQGCRAA